MAKGVLGERFQELPYWWAEGPPTSTQDSPLPEATDVLVVGGGYCGLCAALELARNGVEVTLLDAARLGDGASTRNGGFVTGGQKFLVSGATKGLDAKLMRRILADANESMELLEARIRDYRLDADYQSCGRVILAQSRRDYEKLELWADLLQEIHPDSVSLVPRDRQHEEIGSGYYHGGLLIERYGGLHPGKYHKALVQAAARLGAGLHSHSTVTGIAPEGDGFRVETSRGSICAREVFVATNGYTGSLIPYLQRRVIPVAHYIIATERLPEGLAERICPRRRMYSDTRRDLRFFRLSPDGTRFLFGGRPGVREVDATSAAAELHRMAAGVFPDLNDVAVEYAWQGSFAVSFDRIPHIGCHDGIHYALGCNGSGVAMMSYLGYQVARKLLGGQNKPCAFDSREFPRNLLYRGTPWFLPIVSGWYRANDFIDRHFR